MKYKLPPSAPPYLYDEFIKFLFDHQQTEGKTDTLWYLTEDYDLHEFPLNHRQHAEQIIDLYNYLFMNCEKDLAVFSDIQVALGINILFNNSYSDLIFSFFDPKVNDSKKVSAILRMKNLYKHVFEKRCIPDENREINSVCFMLWDVTPIRNSALQVMEYALYSTNKVCIMSGLHGLGHTYDNDKEREAIIDQFLRLKGKYLSRDIVEYATQARIGRVQ